ncbi:hypothetical protein FBD94_16855 [Pedobacter hiemivivus]|uniref:Uncharacterized protein n=1 Tax=Pedobacter hiemivivus TaxID=2530454 RepID=A0A4U1G610_9SPHI|nr:hypothetical protein [Pedobacter hiemivivus]TKC59201.1 hypothetical protein FBD94_16855 [Pedobacter hiemivivus]
MINNFKPLAKNVHWTLMGLVVIAYVLLISNSNEQDQIIRRLTKIMITTTSLWAGILVVLTLKHGSKEKLVEKIRKGYSKLLDSYLFVIPANILLIGVFSYLAYILTFYRNVEFISEGKVELFQSDKYDEKIRIGVIEPGDITPFRIKIGNRHFFYQKLGDNHINSIPSVSILPLWNENELTRISLPIEAEYELLP